VSRPTAATAASLHALHLFARTALRLRPPLRAKALVDSVARVLPSLDGAEAAREAVQVLFPSGSCLSRAIAIAAALPGAEVVIGVTALRATHVSAHAWLHIDGVSVDTVPGSNADLPAELARLPARVQPLGRQR
jgi:hypothetical protein